jgi:hypothetical protein
MNNYDFKNFYCQISLLFKNDLLELVMFFNSLIKINYSNIE